MSMLLQSDRNSPVRTFAWKHYYLMGCTSTAPSQCDDEIYVRELRRVNCLLLGVPAGEHR